MTIFKARVIAFLVPLLAIMAFGATPAIASFGLEKFAIGATNQNGSPDVQAGSHPYALTNTFVFKQPQPTKVETEPIEHPGRLEELFVPEGDLKDVKLELPPGFVGDPNATPKCSYQTFIQAKCSNESAIGVATTLTTEAFEIVEEGFKFEAVSSAVYNLEPPAGVAAQFGFIVYRNTPVFLDTAVRSGGDYGLTTTVPDISQALLVYGSKVTIWGVPAEPVHNDLRGSCLSEGLEPVRVSADGFGEGEDEQETPPQFYQASGQGNGTGFPKSQGDCPTQAPVTPLLTNPTSCGAPRTASFGVDDWEEPGNFATGEHVSSQTKSLPELAGCEKLDFSPTLSVKPDGEAGSTPTGLNVDLHVPQESSTQNALGLTEADVKDTAVTLPAGMQLSPSAADGLQACSDAQIGFTGFKELNPTSEAGVQTAQFTSAKPTCPDASKIANVKIKTPLLEGELTGAAYLAAPQNFSTLSGALKENPFESLVAMYLVAEEPVAGVLVKLPGEVSLNQATGQIQTTFENTPQLPFSDLQFEFFGTDRAPLATPSQCGTYKTETSFASWSGGTKTPSAEFPITSGPNGSACPGSSLPFSPSLASDMTNVNAGAFSDLTTTLSREDGQQSINSVTLHYPAGLSGILSGVELCGEAQANAGTCGAGSEIGETIVSVGLGNDPFSVTGGKVYLTGPYNGAPFGLSIVNPAKAGPFDLQEGRPVVVRAKIEVNPETAALTITTDPAGSPHAIPTIIDGIPLQIKHVNVNITRNGFTFNPTSCNLTSVTGSVGSAEGASSPVSIPFQVTNCEHLKFTPKFTASATGKNTKADGAGLTTKVEEPAGSMGTQANIAKVKVELPLQLPSRLTTLQKACTSAQFAANPAGCPPESKIGMAVVHTPLVPVPLMGPAIFVSHGGEAFPSLTLVLQGYGVTIDLVGTTYISKTSVTSTTFKAVPDAPFSSFELVLGQGEFSALSTNLPHESHDLCGQKLKLANEFVAQNGAEFHQSTPVTITGCKPEIRVLSHKVKGKTATIIVSVPAAGKLTATGKGISKGTGKSSKAQNVTIKVHISKKESAFLAKHHTRKLAAHIKLGFTPTKGAKLTTTTTVLIG